MRLPTSAIAVIIIAIIRATKDTVMAKNAGMGVVKLNSSI
jgi:hypothetical protein